MSLKVIIFGATGMIGQGVLRECLRDPDVERVLIVVRRPSGETHAKLRELVHDDFLNFDLVRTELAGYDACFWCLGVTSAGMTEGPYRRITHDFTIAAAKTLVAVNPQMTFVFVSAAGADSSERGRIMWARVKGATENAILKMGFKAAHVFRPAFVQPLHGITSRTRMYAAFYAVSGPLYPAVQAIFPRLATTTEAAGRAMLAIARRGTSKAILDSRDINELAERSGPV
jgi:uncharacterized protein YbjT (DUF2867 family)